MNFTPDFSPSFLQQRRGQGMGLGSVPHTLSLLLLPPQGEAPHTARLQPGVPPAGYCPSGTAGSSVGPPRGHIPASSPAPAWAPLPTGPQVLPGAAPARAARGVTASFGHPPALVWGPPWAAGGPPASLWSSPLAAGEPLLQYLEHLLPFLLHWAECLQNYSPHIFPLLFPVSNCPATTIADGLILGQQWICLGARWDLLYWT